LQDFQKTSAEANKAIDHIDSLIGENRADIRQAVAELRRTLTNTPTDRPLNQTLDVNSENIDELLDNFRHVSENLKEFTNTIKSRPYTLIRSSNPANTNPVNVNDPFPPPPHHRRFSWASCRVEMSEQSIAVDERCLRL